MCEIFVVDYLGRIVHDLSAKFEASNCSSLSEFVNKNTGATFDTDDLNQFESKKLSSIFSNKYSDINHDEFTVIVKH